MSLAALIVAVASLALAGLSLGWQVASWTLTAGRVKLDLKHRAANAGGAVLTPVGAAGKLTDLGRLRQQGFGGPEVLAVIVRNVGRMPVTVDSYGVKLLGAGVQFVPLADARGPELPTRIEPGHSETWLADMDDVRRLVYAGQAIKPGAQRVSMTVKLGSGTSAETRHSAVVTP